MEDLTESRQAYIERVEAEGYAVIFPALNELQIDIDSDRQYASFLSAWAIFHRDCTNAIIVRQTASRGGLPKQHITIALPYELSDWQRIALQASLCSDPIRELLSCMRLHRGAVPVTLFTEKKEA